MRPATPAELKQRYAAMSREQLASIDRSQLTQEAQAVYDAEIEGRAVSERNLIAGDTDVGASAAPLAVPRPPSQSQADTPAELSVAHAWFCGVIPVVAIGTILANLSKPRRKRASQGFVIGCLGPLVYCIVLSIVFSAIGDNEDLKGIFGLLGLIGFLVLPFFIHHFVRGSPPPTSAIGHYGITSGSPGDSIPEPDAQPAVPDAEDNAADSRSRMSGTSNGRGE